MSAMEAVILKNHSVTQKKIENVVSSDDTDRQWK